MKLAKLATQINGALEGCGEVEIRGISGLAEAGDGDLSFLANPKYAGMLAETEASAVIVGGDWAGVCSCALLRVDSPDRAMALAASLLGPPIGPVVADGIHASAVVANDARLGASVRLGPHCVVESGAVIGEGTVLVAGCYVGRDAEIGKDCVLHARAIVRERVRIGDRVILHDGSVIGGDGFGNYMEDGVWKKIPHIGTVVIGDDSEIGVNATVDRARFGATVVGKGVKIDNLVMVGHNVRIGDHTAMAAQVGISGSTRIGSYVMLGGQAGLAGHLEVGDAAVIGAQAGITRNVPPKTMVTGTPALPFRKAAENHSYVTKLGELRTRVKELEAKIAANGSGV